MKRIYKCTLIMLICLILCATSCSTASKESTGLNYINSYKDIPGVTQEEIAAVEALKATGEIFLYGHMATTEAFMLPDGTYAGFIYKFCGLLTNLFGMEFSPKEYSTWDSLIKGFDDKSVDFLGDLTVTPERTQQYYMTHAIAERSLRLFTRAGSSLIVTENDVEGLTIGFFTGTITAESIKKSYNISFNSVDIDSFATAAEKLESGEIDAFVMESIADSAFDDYDFIMSREFFPLVYNPVSLATANPDLAPVISVVNKYIAAGGIDKLYEIYKEGDYEYTRYKLTKSFTDAEKAYIAKSTERKIQIPVAYENDNYPISFYNEEDKELQGIAVDVLNEVTRLTGLEFVSMTTMDTPWAEIMEMLKSGEISMVTELVYSEARAKDFIWASTPTISSHYAILSKLSYPDLSPQQVVRETVGVMRSSIYEDTYSAWFYDHDNLVAYDTQYQALDALEKGEVDLLMATELLLLTQTNYREKPGYKVNIGFSTQIDSQFGFNKNETLLRSIIDKAMLFINIDSVQRGWTSRTFDYSTKLANIRFAYLLVFSIVLLAILIVTIFLFQKNKRLGKELALQTEDAKVASKSKTTFLAHMSHEIRTPLNAIIGMAGIAKNSMSNPVKVLSSIDQIIISSHHLLGVLNDVLDMSKIESGKLELVSEPFSLIEAYNEVESIITQRCHEKKIHFITNISEMKDIVLIGDKLRINQVLINLLGNAVKFTPNKGRITFLVDMLEENEEDVLFGFSISDNGIGMSQEQIDKLFLPFEQGGGNITAKFGGTGLGLSISQNLINMMGSEIKADSIPNIGSKFHFEVRFKNGGMPAEKLSGEQETLDLNGKRILLVEDIEINRIIVHELLSSTGVEVHDAKDGQIAIDIFEKSPAGYYSLIFMDVQMPVMDGYESTKKIRLLEREDAKKVPIIAMTANAYKEDIDSAIASGMNAHLPKPIDIDDMMKMLAKFML